MKIENFDFSKVPSGYPLCFNNQCSRHESCMHFVAGQHVTEKRTIGYAVYPSALKNGDCCFFREACEAQLAWGFKLLYQPLPKHLRAEARNSITWYLGSVGTYYRYQNGERKLTSEQQQYIKDLLHEYGYDGEPQFEHYEPSYNF